MTTYTANTTFYLRWYDHDDRATWYGSNSSNFDHEHPLDQWVIPAQETTFYVCTNQTTTMFARLVDTGNFVTYGAKFDTNPRGCNLRFTPKGPLELEAGLLISDDPKFQIKQGGTSTPCTFTWNGSTWSYQIAGAETLPYDCIARPTIALTSADPKGALTITIVDESHRSGRAAIYHADATKVPSTTPLPSGTAVGLVDTCEFMPSSGRVELSASASDTTVYTLNLFVNRLTRLMLASG
jgi:hypothetical protein